MLLQSVAIVYLISFHIRYLKISIIVGIIIILSMRILIPKILALFVSSHKYIISPILNAFCNNVNEQTELAKIGYCCKHYLIKVPNKSKKNIQYYSIEINILSNIKSHAP